VKAEQRERIARALGMVGPARKADGYTELKVRHDDGCAIWRYGIAEHCNCCPDFEIHVDGKVYDVAGDGTPMRRAGVN
jgi:hypothetical protein